MAVTWNTLFENYPDGSEVPDQIDELIQTTREAVGERLRKEHTGDTTSGLASEDGWHRSGAAKIYNQETAPSTRPDGSTSLTEDDNGRIWRQPSTGQIAYYQHDAGATTEDRWVKQLATSSEFTAAENISAGEIVSLDASGEAQVADASVTSEAFAVGVALETVTTGQSVIVQKSGLKSGFSGLIAGTAYFLGDDGTPIASGSIGDSWLTVPIGIAVSSSELDLNISFPQLRALDISMAASKHVGEVFTTTLPYELPGCKWTSYEAISQTLYSELFSKIGHLYAKSASDATTAEAAGTFHIPDGQFLFSRGGRTYKIDETAMPAGIVLTITDHGFATDGSDDGRPIKFLRRTPSASPTLDSGIDEYTQYYIAVQDADTVRLYTTEGDAETDNGSTNVVTFSGDGSGDIYASTMGCYQLDQMQRITGDLDILDSAAGRQITGDVGTGALSSSENGGKESDDKGFLSRTSDVRDHDLIIFDSADSPDARTSETTAGETRPSYASFGMQIKVSGTSVTGEAYDTLKYDTGWVANSDWTNVELAVNHGLSANLTDLIIEMYLSSDGTEENAIAIKDKSRSTSGDLTLGIQPEYVDANNIVVQTGTDGVPYLSSSGLPSRLAGSTSYYYRIVVYKPDLFTKVKEVVDQEWSLSGNGVQEYTLPDPADVANVILRWTGGTPDTDEVQIQAGTTINGIDSEKWILEGEGFLELIPNKLATGFLTRNTGIWDTYDETYDSIDYPQDKYTNGKITRRGNHVEDGLTQDEMFSVFDAQIPNVGDSSQISGSLANTNPLIRIRRSSATTMEYLTSNSSSEITVTDGSGTNVTSGIAMMEWETKNTKWSV